MNRKLHISLLLILGLILSACGNKEISVAEEQTTVDTNNAWDTGYSEAELRALGINGNPLDYKTVYFEYNSTSIDRRSEIIVDAHGRYLRDNSAEVGLAGHADERGSRDYNLALGERRSNAVSDRMSAAGANSGDLNSISYGEERPVDSSHSEAAWQENRRVEITY